MLLSELNDRDFQVGDYLKIQVTDTEDSSLNGDYLIIRPTAEYCYLLSNLRALNGAWPTLDERTEHYPNINYGVFRYSYKLIIVGQPSVGDVIADIMRCCSTTLSFFLRGEVADFRLSDKKNKKEKYNLSLMSDRYADLRTWSGMHYYHASHSEAFENPSRKPNTKPYRIGVELEVVAKTQRDFEFLTNLKSNWITMERDSSLPVGLGIELVTIPLNPADAKNPTMWQKAISMLSNHATAWKNKSCGLHVHIGREIFGDDPEKASATLGKLLYLYHEYLNDTELNTRIFGRSTAYNEVKGHTEISSAVKILGREVLKNKDIVTKLDKSLKEKSESQRYFDINLQNTATIEFRKGKGSINVDRIISIITYCEMMIEYCKVRQWSQISYGDFTVWMEKNVSKTSPLMRYFSGDEAEN